MTIPAGKYYLGQTTIDRVQYYFEIILCNFKIVPKHKMRYSFKIDLEIIVRRFLILPTHDFPIDFQDLDRWLIIFSHPKH